MKLARWQGPDGPRVVAVEEAGLADLGALLLINGLAADGMRALIKQWAKLRPAVLDEVARKTRDRRLVPLVDSELLLPVEGWGRVIGIGHNYRQHVVEMGRPLPELPEMFLRLPSSLIAPYADIQLPRASLELDLEVELAVVIGAGGRAIKEEAAPLAIFGYTVANDVSLRDFQHRTSQWTAGKNFEQTAPVGPWIVTRDEIAEPEALVLSSQINGQPMQEAPAADMIFPVARLVAEASIFTTLEAGDLILTGTPSGVGAGRRPPRWLKAGEEVTASVSGIGQLRNRVVAETRRP